MNVAEPIPNNFYVYLHSRIGTGEPFYIGKGKGKRAHSRAGRNQYWDRIVKKDGDFYVSLLSGGVDEEFAMLLEIEAIALFRARGCTLVNMTDGGDGASGHRPSDESRAKMSESSYMRGKPAWNRGLPAWNRGKKTPEEVLDVLSRIRKGKKLTEEHKTNISLGAKGIKKTEEWKRNLSLSKKGKSTWRKGRPLSEEHKANISKALLLRKKKWQLTTPE